MPSWKCVLLRWARVQPCVRVPSTSFMLWNANHHSLSYDPLTIIRCKLLGIMHRLFLLCLALDAAFGPSLGGRLEKPPRKIHVTYHGAGIQLVREACSSFCAVLQESLACTLAMYQVRAAGHSSVSGERHADDWPHASGAYFHKLARSVFRALD